MSWFKSKKCPEGSVHAWADTEGNLHRTKESVKAANLRIMQRKARSALISLLRGQRPDWTSYGHRRTVPKYSTYRGDTIDLDSIHKGSYYTEAMSLDELVDLLVKDWWRISRCIQILTEKREDL